MADTPEEVALKNYQSAIDTIVNIGRDDYGDRVFDDMSGDIADAIGPEAIIPFMVSIAETDAPQRIIEHLAADPAQAKKIASMSPARRAAALGRIEAHLMPEGSGAGAEPAWKARVRGGEKPRLTDDASDASFEKAWKIKYPNGFIPPSARR